MRRCRIALLGAVLCAAACTHFEREPSVVASAGANERFDAVVESVTSDLFHASPELATYFGVDEQTAGHHLDRLDDHGAAGRARARALCLDAITRLEAVDAAPLAAQRRLTRSVLIERIRATAAANAASPGPAGLPGLTFPLYAVNQLDGMMIDAPQLMSAQQPVTTGEEARAYVARLRAFGPALAGVLESLLADDAAGLRPPDFVIDKSIAVADAFLSPGVEDNLLYAAFAEKLTAAGADDAQDRLAEAAVALREVVFPAYREVRAALVELRPRATHDASISTRPGGAALYRALLRLNADSDSSPEEIDQIGLAEVARISSQMNAILDAQGDAAGPLGERMARLSQEARFLYPNTDDGKLQLIADLNTLVAEVQALTPSWFGTIPKAPVEIRREPAFTEDSAPLGHADYPFVDGTRPGIYWINMRDTANTPRFFLKTLTYHEAVPGHHYQVALGLQQDVPLLRQLVGGTNAFAEGWGMYAERLAFEMGLYRDDPYGNLGRLRDELFRAVRLVVDTGIHAMGWSREQAIAYMVDAGVAGESDAVNEVERYAVWPGQALGYKIGMLKLLELRQRAQTALGARFDIRAFHDVVLADGGLPLPVLEQRIDDWIATR